MCVDTALSLCDYQGMEILVIDAQGGGLGRALGAALRAHFPDAEINAVGTNSIATQQMLKAGASHGATGENPVVVLSRSADIIIGPIGICIADSMYGEVTPVMAEAVGKARAKRILVPVNICGNIVVGVQDTSLSAMIDGVIKAAEAAVSA